MEYNFSQIEKKWQQVWRETQAYKVSNESDKPKYYVLDMFPYPSGAGLHVGHPLGYIASDIYSRYKRLKGFNVLHPMGYDAFGLPAEQYAIEHGIHPAVSTDTNIGTFRKQLDNIGFCYDWDREVRTCDTKYYKWTQWIFLQLFNSYFDRKEQKAKPISELEKQFMGYGSLPYTMNHEPFTAAEWKSFDEKKQQDILMQYRLAFCGYGEVNWCEALGTVLANDEVVNGVSERGGHPVVKKKLRQWYLRITEYADRLLEGLDRIEFSEAMKEMQTNWIGKSSGAEIDFNIRIGKPVEQSTKTDHGKGLITEHISISEAQADMPLRVYTTRPDTIFGVDFMVIAPEHELVETITSAEQKQAVEDYITYVKSRSERERMAEKKISGVFTGAYALNPFDGREIPIWISEYVLAGYGTGAIMAVPCGDERDHKFARHFNIPITNIIGSYYNGEEANPTKDAVLENSGFINGMVMRDAIDVVINKMEEKGIGVRKVNFKMRDAAFSRQRYWGEPFPIVWKNGIAYPMDESQLPLELPHVDSYKPGPEGEGPLANIKEWALIPNPSPQAEKGAAKVPKYSVYTPVQYELAKQMRKEHTEAEGKLWEVVRDSKLGYKFRRQHPVDKYIADFICLQEALIVEVDGGYHSTEEQKLYDEERTRVLNTIGFEVMRFSNEEVISQPYQTGGKIKERIEQKRAESQQFSPLHEVEKGQGVRETNTMPGYAGSSWYFLRYMDPHNNSEFCSRKASDYWNQVDLYIGGTEHAVGHLLYSRMWTKALYDLGYIGFDEPFKKLVNQGMIQGSSRFVYRINEKGVENLVWEILNSAFSGFEFIREDNPKIDFISLKNQVALEIVGRADTQQMARNLGLRKEAKDCLLNVVSISEILTNYKNGTLVQFMTQILGGTNSYISQPNPKIEFFVSLNKVDVFTMEGVDRLHIDVNIVDGYELNIEGFKKWRNGEYASAEFIFEEEKYICGGEVEKMSKRYFNTVNPDDLCNKYGADTFRMYEMFLGPVELSKPWDTKGIEGVHRFIKKFWRLFADELKGLLVTEEEPTAAELKVLHNAIRRIENDTERFSFNTAVSNFMIATNELTDLKCHKRKVLEPLLVLLTPYAPHIAAELWSLLGNATSVLDQPYPVFEEKYVKETSKAYPVAINGKTRAELTIALDVTQQQVEEMVLADETVKKWLEGKQPKKIIYVKNKMINVVA